MGQARASQLEWATYLEATPDLSAREEKKWRKNLLKGWSKLGPLPFDKGDGFYWEADKRGRYIVGGKTKKPKGLLIAMHGGGEGSADASGAASMYASAAAENDWVMLAPQALEATARGWTDSGTEEWVWDLVEQARRTWDIDADHVILAGHSMGGYGTWTLGAHHADRVAALYAAAGAPTPIMDRETQAVIDIDWGVVPNLRNVPMVVYQSTDDPRVPPESNQMASRRIEEARQRWGGFEHYDYWQVDGRGHAAPPGGPSAQFARLPDPVRQAVQDVVVWQPVLDWKRQFYWLFWEHPSLDATVEARLDRDANKISVTIEYRAGTQDKGSGLAVLLDDRLVDMQKEVVVEFQGSEVFRGLPKRRLEVLVETSTSGDPGRQYVAKIPLQ
ncbi:MAG: hypothetical protein H6830_06570 [Planctomycetes bacterium]|nr:hypothetical protein [Planctomycetota bacterium]MCB9910969.1 hypothetical protein [Planctomycetota bacterium]MCB9911564.1 hypothetical protein [Planctomycetota bacterium]HRV81158.1 hypothetical protein [Planctomycetota bacterium]